jgi:tRNA 2-thiouridine synthesizing protein A
MNDEPAKTIDVRGLSCPIPVFEVNRNIGEVKIGDSLEVLATDPAAVPDTRAWAERRGHIFVAAEPRNGYTSIVVKKNK